MNLRVKGAWGRWWSLATWAALSGNSKWRSSSRLPLALTPHRQSAAQLEAALDVAGTQPQTVDRGSIATQLPHFTRDRRAHYFSLDAFPEAPELRLATARMLDFARAGTAAHVERFVRAWRRVDRVEEARQTEARHLHRELST